MSGEKILIVSIEEPVSKRLAKEILEPAGYMLERLKDEAGLKKLLNGHQPDIVLYGIDEKNQESLKIAQEFATVNPLVPVILFAPRFQDPEFVRKALKIGAADCLISPIQPRDILDSIAHALNRKQQLDSWYKTRLSDHHKNLHQRIQELETLNQFAQQLTSQLEIDTVLTHIVQAAVQITGAEAGSLLLLEEETGELYLRASYNFSENLAYTFKLPTQDTLAGKVIETGKPIIFDSDTPEKIKTDYLVNSVLYVPLVVQNKVTGVLGVDHRSQNIGFEELHIDLIQILADYAAIAIENALLHSQIMVEKDDLENILTRVDDGIIVTHRDGLVYFANKKARELFEFEGKNYKGNHLSQVVNYDDLNEVLEKYINEHTLPKFIELQLVNKQYHLVHFSEIPDKRLVITVQDITHYKELDKIKSEFVNTVSHDLRSPLTAILGYSELITRSGEITIRQGEYIKRIQQSVQSITDLINALLDLGRIEAGMDQQKEPVQVGSIIQFTVSSFQGLIESKEQEVVLEVKDNLPLIRGDPIRLRQLFNNLIENAVKYTPVKGKITIRAFAHSDQMIIQVADTGIGIPPEDQPYIFDKMFRASNISDSIIGTGLGLSIVKSIVENHGGRLWFNSVIGEGTIFTIVFPVEK